MSCIDVMLAVSMLSFNGYLATVEARSPPPRSMR